MKTYEMTVVFRADDDEFTKGKQMVEDLLNKNSVTIESSEDANIRMLAYKLKKQEKGHYFYYLISCEPALVIQLERSLRLMQPVLKFLIVKHEPTKPEKKPPASQKRTPETDVNA